MTSAHATYLYRNSVGHVARRVTFWVTKKNITHNRAWAGLVQIRRDELAKCHGRARRFHLAKNVTVRSMTIDLRRFFSSQITSRILVCDVFQLVSDVRKMLCMNRFLVVGRKRTQSVHLRRAVGDALTP